MTAPSVRLLGMMLIFIGATVLGSAGKVMGAPGILFGGLSGWVAARWIMRKLF